MIFLYDLVYCLLQRWNVIGAEQCSFALIGKILKLQNLLQIFKTGFSDNRFIHYMYFHFFSHPLFTIYQIGVCTSNCKSNGFVASYG